DGKTLVVAADGMVKVWDLDGSRLCCQLCGHRGRVWAAAVHPNGRTIASAGADGTLRLWDLAVARAAQEPLVVRGVQDGAIALVPGGCRVAIARKLESVLEVWEWTAAGPHCALAVPMAAPTGLIPTPDGRALLVSDGRGQIVRVEVPSARGD